MTSKIIRIDTRQIQDWDSFHDVFARELGFPGFYGRNMDAWVDCLTSLDEPDDAMTSVHVLKGDVLTLHLDHIDDLASRCPDIYEAMLDCTAFVNYRRIEAGQNPVLVLSYFRAGPDPWLP